MARCRRASGWERSVSMHVLYVEDDSLNRRVVRDMLAVAGVEMSEAPDALTGLQMIDASSYSLVLMDLRMPGMDGMAAIRRIRGRDDSKARLPIVVVTADTSLNICSECVEGGADEVLIKPLSMKTLFDAIGRAAVRRARENAPAAALHS